VCAERWQHEMLSSAGNVDQSHRRWRWWVPEGIEDNDSVTLTHAVTLISLPIVKRKHGLW